MKSDYELQQAVMNELRWDPSINEAHIGVEANQGIVTLSGHVNTYLEKINAEKAAYKVSGVKVIACDIEVILPLSEIVDDTQLAKSVNRLLEINVNGLPKDLEVKVEDGYVTVHGNTEWEYKKQNVNKIFRFLKGMKGLNNRVNVCPHISTITVKSEIENALKRRAHDSASGITVDVEANKITLSGKVPSFLEKKLAIDAAWSTPGVSKIVDNIMINF